MLAATAARAGRIDSTVHGVRFGVSGYSFQAVSLDTALECMRQTGLGVSECWFRHIEPKTSREALREWRLSVPLEEYAKVARKYEAAGVEIIAYTFDLKDDFTDAELDRAFQMARALGVNRIATSTTFTVAPRIVPLMEHYRMEVAFHGHTEAGNPNEFAGPDSFRRVLRMSPWARINLDIGQYVGAGFDPVPFIVEQHAQIPVMHIRDGIKGQKSKPRWGSGVTPIREVLQLISRERYPIVADLEYDYDGAQDPLHEVPKCFEYCRNLLNS
jgi:sugar phosphate isomerase/epimerase